MFTLESKEIRQLSLKKMHDLEEEKKVSTPESAKCLNWHPRNSINAAEIYINFVIYLRSSLPNFYIVDLFVGRGGRSD